MLVLQPASSFGSLLRDELGIRQGGQNRWNAFEFAVAWVNRAGAEAMLPSLEGFLAAGRCVRATVGLDFGSTTYEGLKALLSLEGAAADVETYVFYDENRACTFHPKLYLLRDGEQARLFVGSNNMTGAGHRTNVEAALSFTGDLDHEAILGARQALTAWRDVEGDSRSKRLTPELLELLRERCYVLTEVEVRNRRSAERGPRSPGREPLFGRSAATRPTAGGSARRRNAAAPAAANPPDNARQGQSLLMRVRPRRDGTQLQISMTVHQQFMRSATQVISAADGEQRGIGYDHIRRRGTRVRNLARFEAPELEGVADPVVRFQWVREGTSQGNRGLALQYEVFDPSAGGEGARILALLRQGIADPPVTRMSALSADGTVLSKTNRAKAQWYRLEIE